MILSLLPDAEVRRLDPNNWCQSSVLLFCVMNMFFSAGSLQHGVWCTERLVHLEGQPFIWAALRQQLFDVLHSGMDYANIRYLKSIKSHRTARICVP
jgi:hypothetical protein